MDVEAGTDYTLRGPDLSKEGLRNVGEGESDPTRPAGLESTVG